MITIKRGDTGFGIKGTLTNVEGRIDLTEANVLFLYGKHEIKAYIKDAFNGEVMVFFNKIHTEKKGIYNAEFEVQFKDGRIETFPSDGYIKINIIDDLGGVS